jgi:hypothetical protein
MRTLDHVHERTMQMTPGIEAALVAAPLSLAGALVMRWIEARSRSNAWRREDRLRFLKEKRQAYADFLGACHWVVLNKTERTRTDWQHLEISYQSVLLLAPEGLLQPAQKLFTRTLDVADPNKKITAGGLAPELKVFYDEARVDLGSESTS